MQVLVTAAGSAFGQHFLAALVRAGSLQRGDGLRMPVRRILAVDRHQPPGLFVHEHVEYVRGELELPRFLSHVMGTITDSVFHLAVAQELAPARPAERRREILPASHASYQALEEELTLSFDTTRRLLEACSFQAIPPKFVLGSGAQAGIAAAGERLGDPEGKGVHLALCEMLVVDGARRGLIDARCARLDAISPEAFDEAAARLLRAHDAPRASGVAMSGFD